MPLNGLSPFERGRRKLRTEARQRILNSLRNRAKNRGIAFNLRSADIAALLKALPSHCPVFPNITLVYTIGYNGDDHAELDRIDNDLGYVSGNIRFISRRANRLKSDATAQELYWLWLDVKRNQDVSEPQ